MQGENKCILILFRKYFAEKKQKGVSIFCGELQIDTHIKKRCQVIEKIIYLTPEIIKEGIV